jgi:hypothetical protein
VDSGHVAKHARKRKRSTLSWESTLQVLVYIIVIAAARQYLGVEVPWLMPGIPASP